MKMWAKLMILAALVGGVVALSQAYPEQAANASFAGIWEAKLDGLPGVKLAIASASGNVTGMATFYLIKRNPDGSNPHVDGGATGPMEHAILRGQTLTFDVSRKDGSKASFRMELKSPKLARLFRTNDQPPSPEGEGLPLTRVQ
jgi:hypothetical protein